MFLAMKAISSGLQTDLSRAHRPAAAVGVVTGC